MNTLVCYCILHYKNFEVTIECVNNILKNNNTENFRIVVVDNGSNNNTGERLKALYEKNEKIHIIINESNLGFARGNNISYDYAKCILKADIIVMMNSDIMICNTFSAKKICEICKEGIDIIIPDIINKIGNHQNPLRKNIPDRKEYLISMMKNIMIILGVQIPVAGKYIYFWYQKRINNRETRLVKKDFAFNWKDFVPHGSCIIFNKKWIEKEDFAFVPITFLYCEEEILYSYIKKNKYSMLFYPDLCVKHLEDASIDYAYKNGKEKLIFRLKCQTKSIISYLKFDAKQ